MYIQYACFEPYAYFSAKQAHEVLRIRMGNMATFQCNILFACNTQNPVLRVCHIKCRPRHKKIQNAFISEKISVWVNLLREATKLLEAKYLRFPAKKFAETQINYESNESSYGKQGLKSVDIDPLITMPLPQNTMNF